MTSRESSKPEPPVSAESDLLTPEEFKALQEHKRETNRQAREARLRLKARKAAEAAERTKKVADPDR
jgi:hypothetical protein